MTAHGSHAWACSTITQAAMPTRPTAHTRRSLTGTGTQMIGHELDLAAKVVLDVHNAALLGYSYMWPGEFIDATGPSDDPSLLYAQIEYKF